MNSTEAKLDEILALLRKLLERGSKTDLGAPEPFAVRADEAIRMLGGVSVRTFRRLTSRGQITRLPGDVYSVEQIRRWVEKEAGL